MALVAAYCEHLTAQQRCKIRRALESVVDAPEATIQRVAYEQAEHYGISLDTVSRLVSRQQLRHDASDQSRILLVREPQVSKM